MDGTTDNASQLAELQAKIAAAEAKLTAYQDLEKKLQDAQKKVEEYGTLENSVESLIDENATASDKERAMRSILGRKYSPEKVEEYVRAALTPPEPEPEPVQRGRGKNQEEDMTAQYLRGVEQRLAQMEADRVRENQERLTQQLRDQIVANLKGAPGIKKAMEAVASGKGNPEALLAQMQQDVYRSSVDLIRQESAKQGGFKPEMLQAAAKVATEQFDKSYGAAIGAAFLGRAPETDTDSDLFLSEKPVAPPTYKAGMDADGASQALRDFNLDALSRVAAEAAKGTQNAGV